MTIKAILFDVDGTLVDSNALHAQAWVDAFAAFDIAIPRSEVRGHIGKRGGNLMPALHDAHVVERQGEAISAARGNIYQDRYASQVEPFEDVATLFKRARQDDWKIVIARSGQSEEVDPHLDQLGIRDLIDAVTTCNDAEGSKPDPDILAAALDKIGAKAANTIVVGDSPYVIAAAAKLGIRPSAVRSGGFDDATLRQAGAVAIFDSAADLLARYDGSPLASR